MNTMDENNARVVAKVKSITALYEVLSTSKQVNLQFVSFALETTDETICETMVGAYTKATGDDSTAKVVGLLKAGDQSLEKEDYEFVIGHYLKMDLLEILHNIKSPDKCMRCLAIPAEFFEGKSIFHTHMSHSCPTFHLTASYIKQLVKEHDESRSFWAKVVEEQSSAKRKQQVTPNKRRGRGSSGAPSDGELSSDNDQEDDDDAQSTQPPNKRSRATQNQR